LAAKRKQMAVQLPQVKQSESGQISKVQKLFFLRPFLVYEWFAFCTHANLNLLVDFAQIICGKPSLFFVLNFLPRFF
jgi:hypothetical protein